MTVTRIRYIDTGANTLLSKKLFNTVKGNAGVKLLPIRKAVQVVNESGVVVDEVVLGTTATLATLKLTAKKMLVNLGVTFSSESRVRGTNSVTTQENSSN